MSVLDPAASPSEGAREKLGLPIAIFASAQFVMVLDSSVMNVSISQIVEDLDTTIQGVQLAITAYTLVMAALMLAGAKLGDILGRDRTFALGLAVYGLGSLTTAVSPSLGVLLFGWSLVEGIGAALVLPAIVSVIVGLILVVRRRLRPAPAVREPPKLDVVGVVLSALGLGFVVFGILKSSTWG